ncbi:hypothetical protein [Cerasibacillus terrae]|uniref:hypothetical protein n=1 Tax=Cerasibacillus terrae TaxID=2498845 RepID=UPI00174606FC|nr:hypothetical protein [Cerasibacillus terrae]
MRTDKYTDNIVPFLSEAELNQSSLPNIGLSSSLSKQRIDDLQKFVQEVMKYSYYI